MLACNILWKNGIYCLWKVLLFITKRNSPQLPIPGRIWFPSLCAFWKLNSFHVFLKVVMYKMLCLNHFFWNFFYQRCLLFWTKFSKKHFWWLCFKNAPECCFHNTARCPHFFFWSRLSHIPCSIALFLLFDDTKKFVIGHNSYTYTHRRVLKLHHTWKA